MLKIFLPMVISFDINISLYSQGINNHYLFNLQLNNKQKEQKKEDRITWKNQRVEKQNQMNQIRMIQKMLWMILKMKWIQEIWIKIILVNIFKF